MTIASMIPAMAAMAAIAADPPPHDEIDVHPPQMAEVIRARYADQVKSIMRKRKRIESIRGPAHKAVDVLAIKIERRVSKALNFRKRQKLPPLTEEEVRAIVEEETVAMEKRVGGNPDEK